MNPIRSEDLTFGFKHPRITGKALFGARSILTVGKGGYYHVDFVWDRQNLKGQTMELGKALSTALNSGALEAFKEAIERGWWDPAETPEEAVKDAPRFKNVEFYCCTHQGSGYLYITARMVNQ